jgi:hypothetical protein
VQEPVTKAWYRLYLPVDYVRNNGRHPDPKVRRWPLVMTFHGMKPYDNAGPQEREWEKEADFYGYIVCAPELHTSDSFMEYPLTKEHGYVLRDKRNVMAIMARIFATTRADPARVLSTSWSCGGYLAHYFPNRYPDKFSCIATRLSNFSHQLMIEETVPLYRDKVPVAIFIGDGDFPKCTAESKEAVAWYTARKFRRVRGKLIDNMGHRRIPQVAAAFFAEQLGIEPLRPLEAGKTLAQVQMTDYYPPQELLAKMSPRGDTTRTRTALAKRGSAATRRGRPTLPPIEQSRAVALDFTTSGRGYPANAVPPYDPTPEGDRTVAKKPTPSTGTPADAGATGVALAKGSRPNWLEPTGGNKPTRGSLAPRRSSPRPAGEGAGPAEKLPNTRMKGNPDRATGGKTVKRPGTRKPTGNGEENVRKAKSGRRQRTGDSPTAKPSPTVGRRKFSPQDAGPRDYDRLLARGALDQSGRTTRRSPGKTAGKTGPNRSPVRIAKSSSKIPGGTARRVNVRLSGPAVGTAPHYIAYSVDLPRSVLQGADCLWRDNGVWIADDPRGVKILESPGLHRITVLIITKDDVEYRGSATVHVLEPGPTGLSNKVSTR